MTQRLSLIILVSPSLSSPWYNGSSLALRRRSMYIIHQSNGNHGKHFVLAGRRGWESESATENRSHNSPFLVYYYLSPLSGEWRKAGNVESISSETLLQSSRLAVRVDWNSYNGPQKWSIQCDISSLWPFNQCFSQSIWLKKETKKDVVLCGTVWPASSSGRKYLFNNHFMHLDNDQLSCTCENSLIWINLSALSAQSRLLRNLSRFVSCR